jgi:NAD(P)-dependent dehydrogenase (short-subunit alcohol dehydrogenase family)
VLADIDSSGLQRVADELRSDSTEVESACADVTTWEGADEVVSHALAKFGTLNVLVNIVGGSKPGRTVGEMTQADWESVIALNLTSTFLMCHFAIPHIEAHGGGAVVNVASGAGLHGVRANPAYSAAKAGVIGLTRALAVDHGPRGVRVNCVAPGPTLTPLMKRNRTEAEIADLGKRTLLGRVASPEELAMVIVLLASDSTSYVIGQTIAVDGGMASLV